ncbi:MAG: hypothetical protein RMJ84_11390, partial [Sandaracinaceae bacterium]|nr:hypothetical protein [Sandaracinaceae bacterium]
WVVVELGARPKEGGYAKIVWWVRSLCAFVLPDRPDCFLFWPFYASVAVGGTNPLAKSKEGHCPGGRFGVGFW